ncbi:hypothetical protein TRFO_15779 [Tritrichomonas foetus]|uniref:Uncharacterized protein n=1 Tax=Tritrichomonas foetus TaxID=1144522 RepID=A0A1J4KW28_9EUKA|nr:hypothetical protein TRFO_15779 [Tritrichomonas foetus]|eukprot:OHT13902.1 hypothetical protein TRFO_15779 [Tritrichomonas foetus]
MLSENLIIFHQSWLWSNSWQISSSRMNYNHSNAETIFVSETPSTTKFYLIYDLEQSRNSLNSPNLMRPENYYIKIALSYQIEKNYIIGDFGISELSFPGITNAYNFYIYAAFSSVNETKENFSNKKLTEKKIVHAEVYKLTTSQIVKFCMPISPDFCDNSLRKSFNSIPVKCVFSIVPFMMPLFKPKMQLLPLIAFSFINFIPQITEYNSNWPIISWLRQTLYSCDSSIYDLYNIIFPHKEIDISTIYSGLKPKNKNITQSDDPISKITHILINSPPITDASTDQPGLTYSQVKKIVFSFTRLISLELGLSFHVVSSQPTHSMSFPGDPQLLIFCPSFGFVGTILTEIMNKGVMYVLHSVIRHEDGNFTSTMYSPFTNLLYDCRNGRVLPLNRQLPPLCNKNETYIMLLYVRKEINNLFGEKISPIPPFFPRYPVTKVIKCKIGEKIPTEYTEVETTVLDYDNDHVFFSYDPDTTPFPSIPLEQPCGRTVLQFDKEEFLKPSMIIWHAQKDDNSDPFHYSFVPRIQDLLVDSDHQGIFRESSEDIYAVIQDHVFAIILNPKDITEIKAHEKLKNSLPIQNTVCFEKNVLNYRPNETCSILLSISFTKNSPNDKYLKFVGTPLLIKISASSCHEILNHIYEKYQLKAKTKSIFQKQKGAWSPLGDSLIINSPKTNSTIEIIELLVFLSKNFDIGK